MDRVAPHDLEVEKSLIGALLVGRQTRVAWEKTSAILTADDFFRDAHRRIYRAIEALRARGVDADIVTVTSELADRGDLDEVGPAYLSSVTDVPGNAPAEAYAGIVREKAALRRLVAVGDALTAAAYNQKEPAATVLDAAMRRLMAVPIATKRVAVSARDAVFDYAARLESEEVAAPITTGFIDLNNYLGFRRRTVTLVAARPSVGKTSLVLGMADAVARSGVPVAFFPIEEGIDATAARLLSWRSHVPSSTFDQRTATPHDMERLSDALGTFNTAPFPLFVVDAIRTFSEVAAWCRRLVDEHGVQAVFIDYLQKLSPDRPGRSREEEVSAISDGCLRIAHDLNLAMVPAAQLGRASDDRRDKRPQLSDLRESGALEQDAHAVVFVFREEMHHPKPDNAGRGEIIVAKNRTGPCGIVPVVFDKQLACFRNAAHD